MAISCTTNDLLEASKCFKCIPSGAQVEVQTYLLQQIAGNSMTTDQLLKESSCFKCIPPGSLLEIQVYLLCSILNQ